MQYYITPSPANYPTFRLGDTFFTSNLVQLKRLDFIAYQHEEPGREATIFFHRLCGLPGDTLEIRRGSLYVNNQNLDSNLHLMSHYVVAAKDLANLPAAMVADTLSMARQQRPDSVDHLGLADADVAHYHFPARRVILPASQYDYLIQQTYEQPWNQDNFGPIVIPAGSYFVLGDNRHNALDSRYAGMIAKGRVVGTVLGKR